MLLIKNGFVADPANDIAKRADVLIQDGKILRISDSLSENGSALLQEDCEVIDAEGCVVAPGLVDVHVHFRDPGFTHKEDIETGARAALKGGFTSVVLMANTKPAVDNEETLAYVIEKGKATDLKVYTCANVTKGMAGRELTEMAKLCEQGAVGFTDDGIPIMDAGLLERAMTEAAGLGVPLSLHEENPALIVNNGVNQGKASEYFGIGGSPREAEISLIERDLELALKTNVILNIQHISTKEGVALVRQAKRRGANIHAEATPHHFSLTQDAVIEYGTLAKMNPPLREEADRLAIIEGLRDGTIDMIATDHAPHSREEKERPLTEAPSGIIGLETALPLAITELVNGGYLTMKSVLEKMSANPAAMYHLDAGYLAEGGPADIILVDTAATQVFTEYASKSSNTPFTGRELHGVVMATICGGKVIYQRSDGN